MENVLQWATNVTPGVTPPQSAHPVTLDGPLETELALFKAEMEEMVEMVEMVENNQQDNKNATLDKSELMEFAWTSAINATHGTKPQVLVHHVMEDIL